MDGTVRAYDAMRYRAFRVLKPDSPNQLTSLAIDPSGEIVCAGGFDPYNVYVWNLQTGHLVDVIGGHEGPVSCLLFSPTENYIASGSWDKTIRIYDLFSRKRKGEIYDHNSEITAIDFRPDGKEIVSTTLKGEIYIWDVASDQPIGVLDCRRDLVGIRGSKDEITAKSNMNNKHFKSLCYSADGDYVLAGGSSKYVYLYELKHRILLKRYGMTKNRSLAILDKLNSKYIVEGINTQDVEIESESDYEERKDTTLPGAKRPDHTRRTVQLKMESKMLRFSPSGNSWTAATTAGLITFSLTSNAKSFIGLEIEENVNKSMVIDSFSKGDYVLSLQVSLKLDVQSLIKKVYEHIPASSVVQVVKNLTFNQATKLLGLISELVERSPEIGVNMKWIYFILLTKWDQIKEPSLQVSSILKSLYRNLCLRYDNLYPAFTDNKHLVEYIQKIIQKNNQEIEPDGI
eukprot:TRINITY_DN12918_c0_g1_i1.p1 TRINITY_DN12918_c0_g1~~TRINITY_DN12918_c0_g1_i1.p1  ORF type:complete len:458 (-),score=80.59 TRINITY_DN12918_c0_g1_i1:514-1887(-)